jgi:hypothetical protein
MLKRANGRITGMRNCRDFDPIEINKANFASSSS